MADPIQNKRGYLRQVQQEQAQKKRELMSQQKEDMKSLRQYYSEEGKKVDSESAAAVNHIKSQGGDAKQMRMERMQQAQEQREARQQEVDEMRAERSSGLRSPASRAEDNGGEVEESSVDKKSLYNRKAMKAAPVTQNYETKESDDFYRVKNRGSRVSENNQGYVIEAYAPEHEKDNLRVSIHRNKAVVSGQRKFGDEAVDGNKTMRTNNFQTFREEFNLGRPVTSEGITRERVGDFVRFTIPKLEAMSGDEDE
ncbi:MAG: Hsp20/alpha crystallin family protein [Bdellovibrio sp.]|nr:Hsp20/alpha crystallin family protein [Bdellovibrio sp.]